MPLLFGSISESSSSAGYSQEVTSLFGTLAGSTSSSLAGFFRPGLQPRILQLIDKVDSVEVIRDQIAAILAVESESQQSLANAAGQDPRLWDLRVFVDRTNPWADFLGTFASQEDAPLIVNVGYDRSSFSLSGSDVIEKQKATGTYHLDVYAYGLSGTDGSTGQVAGDQVASQEAMRGIRLVRNILMSGHYYNLGLPKIVWQRFPSDIQAYKPAASEEASQHVAACRFSLDVTFHEVSPQVTPSVIETLGITVTRAETGQVYLTADYPFAP